MNGANQTGSSIVTDGWTNNAAILKAGDIIKFDGVYFVNPMSGEATADLAQFVVTADVTADGAGNATIPVYIAGQEGDGLITTGAYKNVSGSPATCAS